MVCKPQRFGVAVIGCGLIGQRRAEVASKQANTRLVRVFDIDGSIATRTAERFCASLAKSWSDAVTDPTVDIVCVATPNAFLRPIAVAAFEAGKHVLIEKPMGRSLTEAIDIADAAKRAGKLLKIGFNHRYHPAIAEAHRRVSAGEIGKVISIRARYGHGGRPGYEKEWRGNVEAAGGGELTDQGVHIVDLLNWFAGVPQAVFCYLQTAVWPLESLEDNGFALFRFSNGAVASMHTSWTQWKNLFSFEVYGQLGSLTIEGLGKSYGIERLVIARRAIAGGPPEMQEVVYDLPDDSWALEWADFTEGILNQQPYLGNAEDGLATMAIIDALYRSAGSSSEKSVVFGPDVSRALSYK